jgi:DNA-binding response OmpR family regulator
VAQTIRGTLERDGWLTKHAETLAEGFAALKEHNPCIVIVDLGLPDGSGMNLVREAAARLRTGVIVVSGRGDEVDRVVGLEVGADDYISKPFSPREMTARVRALYRRLGGDNPLDSARISPEALPATQPGREQKAALQVDDVTLDPARMRIVGPHGVIVNLTGGEANLLSRLIEAGDEPLPREVVAEDVLGHKLLPQQRGIDQLASNLRRKLESIPGSTVRITAVRGKGYRLIF